MRCAPARAKSSSVAVTAVASSVASVVSVISFSIGGVPFPRMAPGSWGLTAYCPQKGTSPFSLIHNFRRYLSRAFIEWLCTTVSRLTGVTGSLTVRHRPGAHPLWMLRYAKAKSIRLIVWMYYSPTVPCLARKRSKAERFLLPLGVAPALSTGRPRVGWLYNAASGNSEVDGKGKPE